MAPSTSRGTEQARVGPPSDKGTGLKGRDPKQGVLEHVILTSRPLFTHLYNWGNRLIDEIKRKYGKHLSSPSHEPSIQ